MDGSSSVVITDVIPGGTVRPSTLVAATVQPTALSDVWDLSRMFLASWLDGGVELTTSWMNDVTIAQSGAEKRIGKSLKPIRIERFMLRSFNTREAWQLLNMIKRMGSARSLIPIYCDFTKVTAQEDAATVTCDTRFRRLFVNQRVAVGWFLAGTGAEVTNVLTCQIASMTDTSITMVEDFGVVIPFGARVYPLMECEVAIEQQIAVNTGTSVATQIQAQEVPGPSTLPALSADAASTDYAVFGGSPIFWPRYNWQNMSVGFQRVVVSTASGITTVNDSTEPRSHGMMALGTSMIGREEAWRVLKFFDRSCGMLRSFYAVAPCELFQLVRFTSPSTLEVKAVGPLNDYADFTHLAVVRRSGGTLQNAQVRAISTVTRLGLVDTITLATALPDTPAKSDVRYLTVAFFSRFDNDGLVEQWTTNEFVNVQFNVRELLNEKTVEIDGIGD